MTRKFIGTLAIASGVVALAALPATAGQRPNTSGGSSGTAVSRGGDSGGNSGSSSSSSSGSGGSVTNSSSSGSGGDHSMPSSAATSSFEAPSRSSEQGSRTRSGSSSGTATTRGGSSGSSSPRSAGSSPSSEHAASSGGDSGSRRAVPEFSRPRDGRPVVGEAANRGSVPPAPGRGNTVVVYPYDPWGFWGGYGFGLGYLYYDPFAYGGYGYGYGYPFGGYDPYGYGGGYYGGGGGGGGYSISQSYHDNGGLRLKIDPKQAQVFVDGAYVGVVDSFNGVFQKLELESGGHKVELKADGFQPLQFDVLITPGETVTYKGDMKKNR